MSKPSAFRLVAGPLAAAELEQMLMQAGAPRPWANRDACVECAERLRSIAEQQAYLRRNPMRLRDADLFQEGVDQLRRVLPRMIERLSSVLLCLDDPEYKGPIRPAPGTREGLRKLRRLESSLFDLERPDYKWMNGHDWRNLALWLLASYETIVGQPYGISANGPAVKFVRAGLIRLGVYAPSLAGVEAGLRRRLKLGEDDK